MQLCSCTLIHGARWKKKNRVQESLGISLKKLSKAPRISVTKYPSHKILPQGFENWACSYQVFYVFRFQLTEAAAVIRCLPNFSKSLLGQINFAGELGSKRDCLSQRWVGDMSRIQVYGFGLWRPSPEGK